MTLNEILAGTHQLISVIGDNVDDLPLEQNSKNVAAAGCLHLSIEHHASIALLVRYNYHRGSAAALIRPQFEAYLRGAWLHRCATEEEAEAFLNDKNPPDLPEMIKKIERNEYFKNGELSALKHKLWPALCSYTHAGGLHITRRVSATEIVSNYSDEEMMEMLQVSNFLALISTAKIAEITHSNHILKPIVTAYDGILTSR